MQLGPVKWLKMAASRVIGFIRWKKGIFYYYLFLFRKERFGSTQIEDEEKKKEGNKTICYSEGGRFKRTSQTKASSDDFFLMIKTKIQKNV